MSRPWMPLYVSDYLGDTQHLGTLEHGAYLLLIMQYWQKGGLPDDDAQLMRIARMTPDEWSNARPMLVALFKPGWQHPRIDAELQETDEKYEKRAKAGHKGGKAAALARRLAKQADIAALPEQSYSNACDNAVAKSYQPHPHPHSPKEESKKETRVRAFGDWPADFRDRFWDRYPHKVGKPDAIKKLEAVGRRAVIVPWAELLAGLDRYIREKPPDRPWCNPATWLNQARWEDQPAPLSDQNARMLTTNRADQGPGRATGREALHLAAMGRGAARRLEERTAGGREGEASDGLGAAEVFDLRPRSEIAH